LAESNKIFLVTASHVVFKTNTLELIGSVATFSVREKIKDSTNMVVFTVSLRKLMDENFLKRHPNHDVATLQLGTQEPLTNRKWRDYFGDAVTSVKNNSSELTFWTPQEVCRPFKDILDGNEIYILGYPVELLNTHMNSEVDFACPLIRKGIISQRNQQTRKLIIDSGVYGGNSGGPVLIVDHPSCRHEPHYDSRIDHTVCSRFHQNCP
jgi:hypothetical protein